MRRILAVAGCAIAIAFICWVGYYANWMRARHSAVEQSKNGTWLNGRAGFGIKQAAIRQPDGTAKLVTIICNPPWPLNWLGETGMHFVMVDRTMPTEEVEQIRALFPESDIKLVDLPGRDDAVRR